MIKLNIGAGSTKLEGFTPIDRKIGSEAYPLNYQEGSVEEIRASHILEHFPAAQVPAVLSDWVRALRPGGRIRISVPDFDTIAAMRSTDTDPAWPRYLMGGQVDDDDFHKSIFTAQSLRLMMEKAGLQKVDRWQSDNTDTAAHPVSLNLEGFKPAAAVATATDIKIAAVASVPRLGWQDHFMCMMEALRPFKIPVRHFTGAFWGQCLQSVLETCVRDELDWVLTVDYDTLFTPQHLDAMFGIFGQNPHIDALAPLQTRRNHDLPLMTVKRDGRKQEGIEVDGSPIQVETAHFGLTLLRVDRLARLPKPWFLHVPGPDGTWSHDEHVDADIYFWKKWAEAGNTAYVAPHVRVGHLEVMVSQLDAQMNYQALRVSDWKNEHQLRPSTPLS